VFAAITENGAIPVDDVRLDRWTAVHPEVDLITVAMHDTVATLDAWQRLRDVARDEPVVIVMGDGERPAKHLATDALALPVRARATDAGGLWRLATVLRRERRRAGRIERRARGLERMLGAGVDLATDDEGRVHLLGSVWRARFGLDDLPLDMLRVDTGRSHDPTAVRRIRIEGAGRTSLHTRVEPVDAAMGSLRTWAFVDAGEPTPEAEASTGAEARALRELADCLLSFDSSASRNAKRLLAMLVRATGAEFARYLRSNGVPMLLSHDSARSSDFDWAEISSSGLGVDASAAAAATGLVDARARVRSGDADFGQLSILLDETRDTPFARRLLGLTASALAIEADRDRIGRAEAQLSTDLLAVFQNTDNGIALLDDQLRMRRYNERFDALVAHIDETGLTPESAMRILPDWRRVAGRALHGNEASSRFKLPRRGGGTIWFDLSAVATRAESGTVLGVALNLVDATEAVEHEQQLVHAAHHDPLTGLANRARLTSWLEERETEGAQVHLAVLDLDDFRALNDRFGHVLADHALIEIGRRLQDVLPGAIAARMGGDEFIVACPSSVEHAPRLGHLVLDRLTTPVRIEGEEVSIHVSVGVATGVPNEDLIRQADLAVYEAKRRGKQQAVDFEAVGVPTPAEERVRFGELRDAIASGHLETWYQTILDLRLGQIVGLEALVRWPTPAGVLTPAAFVPLAERSGLIRDLTEAVFARVLEGIATLRSSGRRRWVSMNVSAHDLAGDRLEPMVLGAMDRGAIAPGELTLEITETAAIRDLQRTEQLLARFRDRGVRIALDDFGVGQSSLGVLHRLAPDVVKIDRGFLAGAGAVKQGWDFYRAVVELCHAMSTTVLAEGVEDPDQQRLLTQLGCDLAQGFQFSRPMRLADLVAKPLP